ncbi:MAG: hypothetical protein ACE5RN_06045 [Nitrosopumilaceae archaeon]
MEELSVKKDFSEIYTKKSPSYYLQEMKNLGYRIPDQTKPLYQHLAERMSNYLMRPLKILDLGSSYGINSALLNYELVMDELDDFFVEGSQSIQECQSFFDDLPNKNPKFQFHLVDTSSPALDFAEKAGLCEDSFCINMEKEKIPPKFEQTLNDIDLIISTGCIGYIGWKSFEKIFNAIDSFSRGPLPIFAFTVLRMFPMNDIEKIFQKNNFALIKTIIGPLKQRRFYNDSEMKKSIELLNKKEISTDGIEDQGFYYADFYVAGPSNIKSSWVSWVHNLEQVFVPINGITESPNSKCN